MFLLKTRFYVLVVLCFWLFACDNKGEEVSVGIPGGSFERLPQVQESWQAVALPDISQQPLQLKVSHVVNQRYPQQSSRQLQDILKRTKQLVRQHFSIDVVFQQAAVQPVEELFGYLTPRVVAARRKDIIDITFINAATREIIQQSIFKTLEDYVGQRQQVIAYARPYLLQPEAELKDFIGFSYALVDTLLDRLQAWEQLKAADGKAILDNSDYRQWVWWDSLGYGALPFDVVITKQPVVSVETYGMDVHSSLRGGFTAGTTSYNRGSVYGAYVYISVYPFINNNALLETLRQDKSYNNRQLVDYAAALLTHELGHLLLHLGHPFGQRACVMSPTPVLNYRDWYNHLDAAACALNSSVAMTPGSALIEYNRSW